MPKYFPGLSTIEELSMYNLCTLRHLFSFVQECVERDYFIKVDYSSTLLSLQSLLRTRCLTPIWVKVAGVK